MGDKLALGVVVVVVLGVVVWRLRAVPKLVTRQGLTSVSQSYLDAKAAAKGAAVEARRKAAAGGVA